MKVKNGDTSEDRAVITKDTKPEVRDAIMMGMLKNFNKNKPIKKVIPKEPKEQKEKIK